MSPIHRRRKRAFKRGAYKKLHKRLRARTPCQKRPAIREI
nr:MAG TPA: hypothetical protein [Caudoviricetes sp.]